MIENHEEWDIIGERTQAMRHIEDEVERIEAMEEVRGFGLVRQKTDCRF